MTLNFEFKKDWSGSGFSFSKGQNVPGDVLETGNKAPYTIDNPQYNIEFKSQSGSVKVPFCFKGDAIVEASVAPWLCQAGGIDLTPTPPANTVKGTTFGSVIPLGAKIFSLRNIIIALVVIILIGLYFKYVKK